MTVNLPVGFNREKYDHNYKYHIYEIKAMT